MGDLRPTIGAALDAFGVDVTVTPPGGDPVETRAFWLADDTVEHPVGSEFRRAEVRRVLVIPVAGLSAIPRGTVVSAPTVAGAAVQDWKVDDTDQVHFDHHRVAVVPA